MDNQMNNYIQSMGILAESMFILYSQLIEAGFDDSQAMFFTNEFMLSTIARPISEEGETT